MELQHTIDHRPAPSSAAGERLRRCIVTRAVLPVERLVRFVAGPDGVVVPDIEGRLPGRGLWLCAERDILDRACASNAFARAARTPVSVPGHLAQRVEALLARRCADFIGLARRAGDAVAGLERVRAMLSRSKVAMIVVAHDAAAGEAGRLRAMQPGAPVIGVLSSAELGGVFGRPSMVYAAVLRGRLAEKLAIEAGRLSGFRTLEPTR